jgi:hypothetical protein
VDAIPPKLALPPVDAVPPELALSPVDAVPPELALPPVDAVPPELALPPVDAIPPELALPPVDAAPPELALPPVDALPPELALPPVDAIPPDSEPPPVLLVPPVVLPVLLVCEQAAKATNSTADKSDFSGNFDMGSDSLTLGRTLSDLTKARPIRPYQTYKTSPRLTLFPYQTSTGTSLASGRRGSRARGKQPWRGVADQTTGTTGWH